MLFGRKMLRLDRSVLLFPGLPRLHQPVWVRLRDGLPETVQGERGRGIVMPARDIELEHDGESNRVSSQMTLGEALSACPAQTEAVVKFRGGYAYPFTLSNLEQAAREQEATTVDVCAVVSADHSIVDISTWQGNMRARLDQALSPGRLFNITHDEGGQYLHVSESPLPADLRQGATVAAEFHPVLPVYAVAAVDVPRWFFRNAVTEDSTPTNQRTS